MSHWLLKTEPSSYAWSDLVNEKKTTWSGVANATALIHLRAMKKGDLALIYHTGNEKRAVGVAEIVTNPYPDPDEKDEKLVVVDLKPRNPLSTPMTIYSAACKRSGCHATLPQNSRQAPPADSHHAFPIGLATSFNECDTPGQAMTAEHALLATS